MPTLTEKNTDNITAIIKEQNLINKLGRLVRHLGISMSLMSDSDVVTELSRGGMNAPAATSLRGVATYGGRNRVWMGVGGKPMAIERKSFVTTFDLQYLPKLSKIPKLNNLGVWLGVAWHELGHVLWSVFNGNITVGLNLLEDARIETLLIQKYPKTKAALLAALGHLLNEQRNEPDRQHAQTDPVFMYAWVAGRTHLPRALRTELRRDAEKDRPGVAKQIESIFRQYLAMGMSYDSKKAEKLAILLNQILGTAARGQPTCEGLQSGKYVDKPLGTDSEVAPGTLSEIGNTEDDGSSSGMVDTGSDDGEASDGASTMDEAAARKKQRLDRAKQVSQVLANEAAKDTVLAREVAQLSKYLDTGMGVDAKVSEMESLTPTRRAKELAREIKRHAGQFNDDSGKGVIRKVDHGRLRPMRYERTGDIDVSYDAWEPGLSQEMYIVLMIDNSGSMRHAPITEILYALEVGLGDVATVDPVLWNDSFTVPPSPNTATRMMRVKPTGGTDPTDGLSYAHYKLLQHSAANKLLVFYTDGEFNSSGRDLSGKIQYVDNYKAARAYMLDLIGKGVQVQVLDEQGKGKVSRMRLPKGTVHEVNDISDLPKIVEGWTRTVLTTR